MIELTATQRRALRASAHALKPVVSISQKGLTESVLKEIDRSLVAHELIKVRVYDTERETRVALLDSVCDSLNCAAVQHIGNLLVLWRERPAAPEVAGTRKATTTKRAKAPGLSKKGAAAKTDKVARANPLTKGRPRRATRTR